MSFKQFQQDAIRTEAIIPVAQFNRRGLLSIIALSVAAGNLLDMAKKNIYYNKPIDEAKAEELRMTARASLNNLHLMFGGKEDLAIDPRILHGVVGKFTESTELLEAIQDAVASGAPIDFVNLKEELGDDQWYNAILTDAAGLDMEEIQATVIAKLKARYPDKYTDQNAIERDLETERKVLEQTNTETQAPATPAANDEQEAIAS